ncbi:hypothetical protein RSSM_03045 [Rhodopirellula sallentina SM41]|uniref:Uncharacterized protein n=2 Tax=Rhodopirellula TaxID=265488 RepID=M5U257_9BACT|nr:hypothetical protein RSSM_03045 [Rhodopirellula sallentina SM41]
MREGDFASALGIAQKSMELTTVSQRRRVDALLECISKKRPFVAFVDEDFDKLFDTWSPNESGG